MSQDIQAENETVDEPTTEEASPATEEQTTQDEATIEVDTQVDETTKEEAPESKPKHNAESRIKALVNEKKELQSQLSTQGTQPSRGNGSFSDQFKGKDNVLPEDLDRAAEQYVGQAANSIVDAKLQPLLTVIQRDRLESDLATVSTTYPELDPDSDQYDPKLDKAIADSYAKYGNGARLKDFVADHMTLASAKAERAKQQASKVISKQAEETAVRPGTSSKTETKFDDLSIEEMEAKLGMVH